MLRKTAPWLLLLGFAATPFLGGCDFDDHDRDHHGDRTAYRARDNEWRDHEAREARYHDRDGDAGYYHHD